MTPVSEEPRGPLANEHAHEWGPIEYARFTGNPHRKCQITGCRMVSLDLDEEE